MLKCSEIGIIKLQAAFSLVYLQAAFSFKKFTVVFFGGLSPCPRKHLLACLMLQESQHDGIFRDLLSLVTAVGQMVKSPPPPFHQAFLSRGYPQQGNMKISF